MHVQLVKKRMDLLASIPKTRQVYHEYIGEASETFKNKKSEQQLSKGSKHYPLNGVPKMAP